MDQEKYSIIVYKTINNKEIFTQWIYGIKDKQHQMRMVNRINKMRLGIFGDYSSVGGNIMELRFFFGPGYRIYFSIYDDNIILLLNGGNKGTQKRDIEKAKEYLQDYLQS